ncbi:ANAPC10 [Cordylochernes scorpioides]|uniref:Anaphase-promoting complex subunit 10 n=1 Tax=Cordylochernes scorpioides TaxID=51811 RepID=A0ABY6LIB3_9ARAC|nr:ANAPC10 [Cordylochernes scorpioides]
MLDGISMSGTAAGPSSSQVPTPNHHGDPLKEEREGKVREIGGQAVWSLSSCKPDKNMVSGNKQYARGLRVIMDCVVAGFGVEQLRDNCLETYWQSDGPQPHLVNIQFRKKTTVKDVCIYADYKLDESYTPNRIAIRCGTNFSDLRDVEMVELNEPSGWVVIPLKGPVQTFLVQIAVLSNHQNGRDTHMRQIKIHSPVVQTCMSALNLPPFTSIEMLSLSSIR